MKIDKSPLPIIKPCPKRWEELKGDEKRRFCEQCNLHVHNLSAMSNKERTNFISEEGSKSCIAYLLNPNGTIVTPSFWDRIRSPFRKLQFASVTVLATIMPFLFSSCASRRVLEEPMQESNGESIKIPDVKAPAMLLGTPSPRTPSENVPPGMR